LLWGFDYELIKQGKVDHLITSFYTCHTGNMTSPEKRIKPYL